MKKYKVHFWENGNYVVMENQGNEYEEDWANVFVGSLADCEAYIRLCENGYMS